MYQIILTIHVLVAVCVVLLVLVQQGRGATIGAAFGSGASQTVFGSRGSGSFLLRLTVGFVCVFFATSLILNRLVTSAATAQTEIKLPAIPAAEEKSQPASPAAVPALPALNPATQREKPKW